MASLLDALIQQESGGRPGVVGPRTKWGRPLGLTQMLPATAQEMARKLGVPWRPDLLTARDPAGAAYQRKLGEAYFNEGLQKTGNPRDALRYCHGGPNRQLWGPKTNAYADAVLARAGGANMLQSREQRPMQRGLTTPNPLMEALSDPGFSFANAEAPQVAPQQLANTPQIAPPKPGFFGKGGKGWMLAGILGDALAAYGGTKGVFTPFMMQQNENEAQDNRARERLAAQSNTRIQEAILKAQLPQKPTQTDRYLAEVADPRTPPARRMLLMQVLTNGNLQAQVPELDADEWEYDD